MSFLSQIFSGSRAVVAFSQAATCLHEAECEIREELLRLGHQDKGLRFPHLELAPQAYWERNFFSIMFVSLFQCMDIDPARTRDYAAILHLVRGIVTATDNILDDEAKGAIQLAGCKGRVMPNVLSMLLQNGLLQARIARVTKDAREAELCWGALFDALYAIGQEEGGEEAQVEDVLSPYRLLDEIHRYRGANLLLLAFVVPELNEPQVAREMAHAKAGVFRIGMALQMLDDLADFEEDIRRRNHNLLRSWLVHGTGASEPIDDGVLASLPPESLSGVHTCFPQATGEVMVLAVEQALRGFDALRLAGHPLDRETGREMMAVMFRLRGLTPMWELYLSASESVQTSKLEPYLQLV